MGREGWVGGPLCEILRTPLAMSYLTCDQKPTGSRIFSLPHVAKERKTKLKQKIASG